MGLKYALSQPDLPSTVFADLAVAEGSCRGVWYVPLAASGSFDSGANVLVDVTGTSARTVQCALAAPGNWLVDTADVPTGFAKAINTQSNRGQTNYMGLSGALENPASTYVCFGKVQTPQGPNEWVQFGGPTGGVAAPNEDESSLFMWADPDTYAWRKGFGATTPIAHGDYTGWFVYSFSGNGGGSTTLSKIGDTFGSIGTSDVNNQVNWTGFNAFSGNATNNHETGTGIVKYAGFAMFGNILSQATIANMLIDSGILVAP